MATKPSRKNPPAIVAIAAALGGKPFEQMTGAHGFQIMDQKTLRFRLPAYVANKQINRVTITEMKGGSYTVKFSRKTKAAGVSEEVLVCCKLCIPAAEILPAIGEATGLIVDKFDTTL